MKTIVAWIILGLAIVSFVTVALIPLNLLHPPLNPLDNSNTLISDNQDISSSPHPYQPQLLIAALKSFYQPQSQEDQPVNPSDEDKITKLVRLFNSYFEETFRTSGIPGAAVVIVYNDQIIYMKPLGVKKIGEPDPIDIDTLFQIGSCTKAFTATAIASLVDKGIMTWDDTARGYYPDHSYFDLYDPQVADEITIRDLLSHRSGLPQHAGTFHVLDFWYDFDETLYRLRFLKPESEFRTKYAYQNILLALAGYASGDATGMSWDDVMKQEIFLPLEMFTSTTNLQGYLNSPNHASGHRIINGQTHYVDPINLDPMGPAGTISASIKELANWLRFQLNMGKFNGQQIVSSQSLAETHQPHILIKEYPQFNLSYGLGWLVYTGSYNAVEHTGSTRTFNSNTYVLNSENLGMIVITNEGTSGNYYGELLFNALYSLYKKGVLPASATVSDYVPPQEDDIQSLLENNKLPVILTFDPLPYPIDNYAGNYYSDYWGNIKVEKKNDSSLLLFPGKNPNPITLNHYSSNTFNESDYETEVTFSDFTSGQPQQVFIQRWALFGENGTFIRV